MTGAGNASLLDHPREIFTKAWVIIPVTMWLALPRAGLWHELGHALRARMTGMSVVKLTLGDGKKLAEFQAFGTRVRFGWRIYSGQVTTRVSEGRRAALRFGAW